MKHDPWFPIEYYDRRTGSDLASYQQATTSPELPGYHESSEHTWKISADALQGLVALDLGCGTGRWTKRLTEHCPAAIGLDASRVRIEHAKRQYGSDAEGLFYRVADIASLTPASFGGLPKPEGAMARYIFSHWPKDAIAPWLESIKALLPKGAPLVLMDNRIEEQNRELGAIPESKDAYCQRKTSDGRDWKIRKNYFEVEEVAAYLAPIATRVETWQDEWLWCAVAWL